MAAGEVAGPVPATLALLALLDRRRATGVQITAAEPEAPAAVFSLVEAPGVGAVSAAPCAAGAVALKAFRGWPAPGRGPVTPVKAALLVPLLPLPTGGRRVAEAEKVPVQT